MSNLEDYARSELEAAGLFRKDSDYNGELGKSVMKLIRLFSEECHSGSSAFMTVSLFEKLSRFEPLTPLTGEDNEWNEIGPGVFQNKRCYHVFKENGLNPYDIEGKIFRDKDGGTYTNKNSRIYITFPYKPKSEIIETGL